MGSFLLSTKLFFLKNPTHEVRGVFLMVLPCVTDDSGFADDVDFDFSGVAELGFDIGSYRAGQGG
jgi:hypothetical protein